MKKLERIKCIPVVLFFVTLVVVCYLEVLSDCLLARKKSNSLVKMKDIDEIEAERTPKIEISKSSKNIFFIETSCSYVPTKPPPGGLKITARQACSIYSTAQLNPDYDVYLLYSCPLSENFLNESSEYARELLKLRNVNLVNLEEHAPKWISSSLIHGIGSKLLESSFRIEHVSDVYRLLVLWKFGGTYLDTDFISIRPLSGLGANWIGAQDRETIANGGMSFLPTGAGHDFLTKALTELAKAYNPAGWSDNGPLLVTSTLMNFCNLTSSMESPIWDLGPCPIKIYSSEYLYSIYYTEWQLLFKDHEWKENVKKRLENSFLVHFWNKLSYNESVKLGSDQPYTVLAKEFCKGVYYSLKTDF